MDWFRYDGNLRHERVNRKSLLANSHCNINFTRIQWSFLLGIFFHYKKVSNTKI